METANTLQYPMNVPLLCHSYARQGQMWDCLKLLCNIIAENLPVHPRGDCQPLELPDQCVIPMQGA